VANYRSSHKNEGVPQGRGASPVGQPQPTYSHDWTLQQLTQMNLEIGKLQSTVEATKENTAENTKSLSIIKYTLAFASGALLVITAIIGYVLDKRFDQIMELISKAS